MVELVRRLVAIEEIAGAEPAGRSKFLRRVGQKQTGRPISGRPWSVTTHADHLVVEGKETSPPAVTRSLAGASPVDHPKPSRLAASLPVSDNGSPRSW